MTATALSLNKRMIGAFRGGGLTEMTITGTEVKFFLYAAGPMAVLALVTARDADAERLSEWVREVLESLTAELLEL